jgi:hypothetical protein
MSKVKTTPENVAEANQALFRATMNLPAAAAHCGMTQKEMKMTFLEFLKYHPIDYEITEDSLEISRRKVQSNKVFAA